MDIYVDGKMVNASEAHITFADAGFQHAVGLFETLGVYHGRAFRLEAHLNRLAESAKSLGLVRQLDTALCRDAIQQTLAHNTLDQARIRLTVTAGRTALLAADRDSQHIGPSILVEPNQPTQYDQTYFEKGIMAVIGPAAANPFDALAGHKTLSYWHRLLTLRHAAAVGGGEVIWLNTSNHLASGAVSNLFLVKQGQLLTPFARTEEVESALPAPVLPGVTRAAVIEQAGVLEIPVTRRMLSVADLLDADEAFLTNSSWQVLPVTRIEKETIGNGHVGPVTNRVRQAILALVEQETHQD